MNRNTKEEIKTTEILTKVKKDWSKVKKKTKKNGLLKILFRFGVSQGDLGGITRRLRGEKVQHNTLPLLFQWISAGLQTSDSRTEEGINALDLPQVRRLQPPGPSPTPPTWPEIQLLPDSDTAGTILQALEPSLSSLLPRSR